MALEDAVPYQTALPSSEDREDNEVCDQDVLHKPCLKPNNSSTTSSILFPGKNGTESAMGQNQPDTNQAMLNKKTTVYLMSIDTQQSQN